MPVAYCFRGRLEGGKEVDRPPTLLSSPSRGRIGGVEYTKVTVEPTPESAPLLHYRLQRVAGLEVVADSSSFCVVMEKDDAEAVAALIREVFGSEKQQEERKTKELRALGLSARALKKVLTLA